MGAIQRALNFVLGPCVLIEFAKTPPAGEDPFCRIAFSFPFSSARLHLPSCVSKNAGANKGMG